MSEVFRDGKAVAVGQHPGKEGIVAAASRQFCPAQILLLHLATRQGLVAGYSVVVDKVYCKNSLKQQDSKLRKLMLPYGAQRKASKI